jgi:hypothetical protein
MIEDAADGVGNEEEQELTDYGENCFHTRFIFEDCS